MTLEQFLDRRERLAREGLRRSTGALGDDVRAIFDLPGLVVRHPVLSLGGGGLVGFLLGSRIQAPAVRAAARGVSSLGGFAMRRATRLAVSTVLSI